MVSDCAVRARVCVDEVGWMGWGRRDDARLSGSGRDVGGQLAILTSHLTSHVGLIGRLSHLCLNRSEMFIFDDYQENRSMTMQCTPDMPLSFVARVNGRVFGIVVAGMES